VTNTHHIQQCNDRNDRHRVGRHSDPPVPQS